MSTNRQLTAAVLLACLLSTAVGALAKALGDVGVQSSEWTAHENSERATGTSQPAEASGDAGTKDAASLPAAAGARRRPDRFASFSVAIAAALLAALVALDYWSRGRTSPVSAAAFVFGGPFLGVALLVPALFNYLAKAEVLDTLPNPTVYSLSIEQYFAIAGLVGLSAAVVAGCTCGWNIRDEVRANRDDWRWPGLWLRLPPPDAYSCASEPSYRLR